MPSSRGSSQPRARTPTLQADSLPSEPPGKPPLFWISFSFRSLQSIEYSSLCYIVCSHQLSILYMHACMLSDYTSVQLFVTLWTGAHKAPLSIGFSRQEHSKWVATSSFRGSSLPRDQTCISYVSCIGRQVLCQQHHLGNPFYAQQCIYVNQNYSVISLHTGQHGHYEKKNLQTINAGEDVEKRELSYTVGKDVRWYIHYEEQYGGFFKNQIQNYHMTQ